jgi:hypothetical protein
MLKRSLLALALLAALSDAAQTAVGIGQSSCTGGVSQNSTAAQDQATVQFRDLSNAALCLSHGLAQGCTQSALNAVSGCAAGACGTIYASNAAGAQQFALDKVFALYFTAAANQVQASQVQDATAGIVAHGGETATNLNCTNAGLANGCLKVQVACVYLTGTSNCKP